MSELYRTIDIAERAGVSKQKVYRYIKERGFLPVETVKIYGHDAYLYDEKTVQEIEEYFRGSSKKSLTNKDGNDTLLNTGEVLQNDHEAHHNEALCTVLLKQIELLEQQLHEKDKQIRDLLELSNNLARKQIDGRG